MRIIALGYFILLSITAISGITTKDIEAAKEALRLVYAYDQEPRNPSTAKKQETTKQKDPMSSETQLSSTETHVTVQSPFQAGIANEGVTCFLNAALQFLFNIPEFRDKFLSLTVDPNSLTECNGELVKALQNIFTRLTIAGAAKGSAIKLDQNDKESMTKHAELNLRKMEDSGHAIDKIFEKMPKDFLAMFKFEAEIKQTKGIVEKGIVLTIHGHYVDVKCPANYSLRKCLLEASFKLKGAPNLLTFRFGRLERHGESCLSFDESMNLKDISDQKDADKEWYDLASIVKYPGGYHYTAVVRNYVSNHFYFCNDDDCSILNPFINPKDDGTCSQVTIIQYRKRDTDHPPSNSTTLHKDMIMDQLGNTNGYHRALSNETKKAFEQTIKGYTKTIKSREIIKLPTDEPQCVEKNTKTILPSVNELEGFVQIKVGSTFNGIKDRPLLSAATLILFNIPSIRNQIINASSSDRPGYHQQEILRKIFLKMIYSKEFLRWEKFTNEESSTTNTFAPTRFFEIDGDDFNGYDEEDKIKRTFNQTVNASTSIEKAISALLTNVPLDFKEVILRPDQDAKDNIVSFDLVKCFNPINKNQVPKTFQSLDDCLDTAGIKSIDCGDYLSFSLPNKEKDIPIEAPRFFQPEESVCKAKGVAIGYELRSFVVQLDEKAPASISVYLKSYSDKPCWYHCNARQCKKTTFKDFNTKDTWKRTTFLVYSKFYPKESAPDDSEFLVPIQLFFK